MAPTRNVMERSGPLTATDQDFTALLEAHLAPNAIHPQEIEIQCIQPNPFQARRTFDVTDLVAAIKAHGFTSRLRVRQDPANPRFFQLAFGERRLRAAEQAGLSTVPCDVGTYADEDLIEIGLTESVQRHELKPLEEAHAFQTMIDERKYSVRRLAERIGMDKGYVENRLALLRTPLDVQKMVEQRPDTMTAAREIAKIANPQIREHLITQVIAGTLTKEKVRQRVRSEVPTPDTATQLAQLTQAVNRDIDAMRAILARWRQTLPQLDTHGREHILAYIEEYMQELEHLTETLRS